QRPDAERPPRPAHRRRQGQLLRPVRRRLGAGRVHRAALGHPGRYPAQLSVSATSGQRRTRQMMLFGKTVAITGVASGIGRRTAELAAQMGADVIGIDRNPPAQAVGDFIRGDLSSAQGAAAVAQALPDGIDALLNIAGVSGNTGAAPTLAVNFYGLRALSQALAPRMRAGGAIVSVASIAGYGWRGNLDRARALVGA